MSNFNVGDEVVLVKVPGWLLKDLPEDEQREIMSFVGQSAKIIEVDKFGYLWIGFGLQVDHGKESRYSGHSFAVTADCLKRQ
jgi:hypothetical protein